MSNRILDMPAVDKLSTLVSVAKETGLFISIDFMGTSTKHKTSQEVWIMQMFDAQERTVVSSSGASMSEVISKLYTNWFAKTAPKT